MNVFSIIEWIKFCLLDKVIIKIVIIKVVLE